MTIYNSFLNPRYFRGRSITKEALLELETFLREVFAGVENFSKVTGSDMKYAIREVAKKRMGYYISKHDKHNREGGVNHG